MNKVTENLILGIMCFLLVVGIMIQSKTVQNTQTAVARTTQEAELRDSILRYQEKYDNKYTKLEEYNKKLDQMIEDISKKEPSKINYPEELKKANALLGYTDVEGPGIIVTVQDGDPSTVKGYVSNYLVHDGDLVSIVNLLKSGGAEAISINDERIISTTGITCAGNIVRINGNKIGSPFVVKATGLTEKLYGTATVTDSLLKDMENQGVQVSIEKKDNIKILKYNGVNRYNFVQEVK